MHDGSNPARAAVISEQLSYPLRQWAQRAGFADGMIDGGVMWWSQPDGQTLIYLRAAICRPAEAGWITVSMADRDSDEEYVLSTPSLRAAECYLYDFFGAIIRDAENLPVLELPPGGLAPGYRKVDGARTPEAADTVDLLDRSGAVVARTRRGLLGAMHLAVISQLLEADAADIQARYLGSPGSSSA